ncbi:unnamed protein product (macronuclear) [Paramecium tetraurelia]|uniref:Acyl-coenzyme A oxidase n=1 Tax=Paramecium tetraurelia TaxID=5888 RepID=A0BNH5_PARTE|nr:uncharacterized protein GSPATT00030730001 [Paramecium tetraurelia]CAK60092.1 unnamed protein product [Paramecium tetraurelia]|eukprot:XP_001427490.1 hypothetical protein (macronuclear) [Paramecium tetraurelia strain d4-2]
MHPTTQLLENARERVTFPTEELTKLIYVNDEIYETFMKAQKIIANEPTIRNHPDYHNWSRKQQIIKSYEKLRIMHQHFNLANAVHWAPLLSIFQGTTPTAVSFAMTVPALRFLGTDEQFNLWGPKFLTMEIVAAYAQTEIGHGSDVQNLETTATYDPQSNDFVLHTPSVSAVKFWPGELGFLSNYALVYAKLIFNGKNKGVHPFMVQIRDNSTHKPLRGVTVGDIGPKLGYSTKDNGYLAFDNYRIPLNSMLARYVRIENGQFSRHGNEKISYASMMVSRQLIIFIYPRMAAQALTVAIRYSITRQQFTNDKREENSVIEYQTQQDKLLPRLATCYGMIFAGIRIMQLVDDNFHRVQKKDFSTLQQSHAILSAIKAFSSQWVVDTTEWCRLSCGGHGYAHYSGIPAVYFDTAPNVTLEGENQVMYLQVARYLLKVLQYAEKTPEKVPFYFSFVLHVKETLANKDQNTSLGHWLKLTLTIQLIQVGKRIKDLMNTGKTFQQIWNEHVGIHLMSLAQRYAEYFIYLVFQEYIANANPSVKEILQQLCDLYCVQTILDNPNTLIESGQITQEQLKAFNELKIELFAKIKPQAIGLVEAFNFNDNALRTCIGCHDGKPYEYIYDWATKENSVNKVPQAVIDLMGTKIKAKL